MTYTITRENGERDLEALKAILANDGLVLGDVDVLQEIAASIAEQVKPAIEEPTAFGSVVRARTGQHEDQLWTPAPYLGEHYWMAETRAYEVWPELTDLDLSEEDE